MIAFFHARPLGILGFVVLCTSSCGPEVIIPPRGDGGAGGASSSSTSSSSTGGGGSSDCVIDDVSTWKIEAYNAEGNHPRFVAATSGVPWVALAVQGGNVVLEKLGIDDQVGIVVSEKFEIPDNLVYPLAFDANDERFVLLTTTGHNWNGTLELWLVDRASGTVKWNNVGYPDNPNYTIRAALGLVGDYIALAYARPADNKGMIEIRDGNLNAVASQEVASADLRGVWRNSSAMDIYIGSNSRARVEPGSITIEPVVPSVDVIGGLGAFLVDIGDQIRLTRDDEVWAGKWPHTQISPPAIVRTYKDTAVFALETELTGVVGYPKAGALEWMDIESMPGASGVGVVLLPVIEERRLGLFYVGLEIPHPEQPLRYFGRVCH